MGRFCSLTLLGRLRKRITIISAYQVPKNSGSRGKTTSLQQQVLQLKKDGDSDQHPPKHFCASLDIFIDNKITAGHQIILGGDFNEDVSLNLNGITRIIANHNLVDVMRSQLGTNNEPPTYSPGSKRIHYILMTADVASLVKACGAEHFNHRFFSDHRGLYADLRLSGLFDRNLSPLASPKYRDIQSGNLTLIRKYITTLSARLAANKNIPAHVALLASNVDNHAAEQLDTEMTGAMLAAGKVCAHTARLPISPQLHEAQTRHRIFQQVLTQLHTHRDMSHQITKRQGQLTEHIILPTGD
jgi:hypothetical protein